MSQTIQKHPDMDAVQIMDNETNREINRISFIELMYIEDHQRELSTSTVDMYNAYQWYMNYKERM